MSACKGLAQTNAEIYRGKIKMERTLEIIAMVLLGIPAGLLLYGIYMITFNPLIDLIINKVGVCQTKHKEHYHLVSSEVQGGGGVIGYDPYRSIITIHKYECNLCHRKWEEYIS